MITKASTRTSRCLAVTAALLGGAIMSGLPASSTHADTVAIGASKDNTLFEEDNGLLSNGSGVRLFSGRTAVQDNTLRRAVIAFDVAAAVPAGATITGARLTLHMSKTIYGNEDYDLHRLTTDWGEGTSNASGAEGQGAPSAPGDATWKHTFYDTAFWTNPGGDFVSTVSATATVGAVDFYTWGSTPQLVADVQDMLDSPAGNFGWILIGDEATLTSAKRFDSSNHNTVANRPQLTIDYTIGVSCPADLTGAGGVPDGMVDVSDLFLLLSNWNTNGPGADLAAPNDVINVSDLFAMLSAWGDC